MLIFALKMGFSASVLAILLWRFRNDIPSLSVVDRVAILQAIGLLMLQPVLIAVRWRILLRQYNSQSSYVSLLGLTWAAVFANQFLPAGVGGDAVRIFYAHRLGNGLGAATASVLMDRILALVAMVLLIAFLSPWLPSALHARIVAVVGALCAAALLGLVGVSIAARRRLHDKIQWSAAKRLVDIMHYVLRTLSYPAQSLMGLAVSVLVHLISFVAFLLILDGFGIRVERMPFLAVAALLTFAQIVPISIGGWGAREIAAISLLGTLGVDPGPALLLSLTVGVCYALASLPGALIWPFIKGKNGRRPSVQDAAAG